MSPERCWDQLLQWVVHGQLLQDLRLAGLADLAGQEHLVHHRVDLVEVEHQIQLANIVEILVENLDKVVDGLQVVEVVVAHIHTDAKVEASVAPIHNLEVAKFYKVGVLGISHRHDWKKQNENVDIKSTKKAPELTIKTVGSNNDNNYSHKKAGEADPDLYWEAGATLF